jgi:hypothetical protein
MSNINEIDSVKKAKAFIWGASIEAGAQDFYEEKGQERPSLWIEHWQSEVESWGKYAPSARAGRRLARWRGGKNLTVIDVLWHAREHANMLPKEGELFIGERLYAAAKKAGISPDKNINALHESTLMGIVDYF